MGGDRLLMKGISRAFSAFLAAAMLFALSGCYATKSAQDFYSLPQFSERYIQLQEEINKILTDKAEFSAPIKGGNRQAGGDGQTRCLS